MLEIKNYKSSIEGPVLGFIGAIHGNEVCGVKAINKLISNIDNGDIKLKSGEINLLPIANPKAYAQGVRFCEINLNRVFVEKENPELYEEKLAQEIIAFINKSDVIIDIHSNHAGGVPFVFQDVIDEETTALVEALPVASIMRGWIELYGESDDSSTLEYTYDAGKYGVTIECGEHADADSVDVAYKSIISTLRHFDMINEVEVEDIDKEYMTLQSFIKKPKGGKFFKDWLHGDKVQKDEEIGVDVEGNIYKSDVEGFICLPFAGAAESDEWFYLAS